MLILTILRWSLTGASDGGEVDQRILLALSKITDNITKSLDARIDIVLAAIHDHTSQIQALGTRVNEAETRISSIEDTTQILEAKVNKAKVNKLEKQVGEMAEHLDDLEKRNCRCTVRIVGFTGGYGDERPSCFSRDVAPLLSQAHN